MSQIDEITREKWILGAFPEWGTWLNKEVGEKTVEPGHLAIKKSSCCGATKKICCNINAIRLFGMRAANAFDCMIENGCNFVIGVVLKTASLKKGNTHVKQNA